MKLYFYFVFVVVGVAITKGSWICTARWFKVFSRLGSNCVIPFRIPVPPLFPVPETVQIKKINVIVAAVYYSDPPRISSLDGYKLSGDVWKGELTLTIEHVTAKHAVSYVVIFVNNVEDAVSCATLYVLGVPTTPSISIDKDPSVGESVTLVCSSKSTTTPSNHSLSLVYNWKVDGVDNPSGSRYTYSASGHTLTMSNAVKDDAGKQITCTSTENVTGGYTSVMSIVLLVSVFYGPESITFSPSNTTYALEENNELPQITCNAVCNPLCSFRWIKQASGLQISSKNVLQLGNLTASEAGTYRCTATRSGSVMKSKDLTVNVIYGPYPRSTTLSPTQTAYTVNENEILLAITCHADCYPECSYTWTKHRDGLTSVVSRSTILVLGTVNRYGSASYICSAVNELKMVKNSTLKEVQIKVNYGPDGACDNVSSLQTFTEGDSTVSIRCFAECFPGCSYTWSKGSVLISNSGELSLGSIRRYQAGNYTLLVSNAAQTYSRSAQKIFSIVVNYAPVVSIEFSTMNRSEGTSLILLCRGEGVPPNYTYTGLTQAVGGVRVPNTVLERTEAYSHIHFSKLQLQDTGNYTCKMNNGIRDFNGILDQTETVQLLVEVQPKILEDDLKYAGAQSNPITVHVPFYCYPAVQSVIFVRYDGTVIQNSTKYRTSFIPDKVNNTFYGKEVTLNGYIAVLTVNDLEEEDFTNYTLTVHNSRGTTSVFIFIVAESIPSIPRGFFLSSAGLSFFWEKGFNGGHLQTFIIQVSAHGKEVWHNLSKINEEDASYQVNRTFYSLKIRGLNPGTYRARLIAANSLGETAPLYLYSIFTVMSDENTTESQSHAAAVGGSVSALLFVIVVAFGVVVWRRRVGKNGLKHEAQTRQNQTETTFCENSYYNVQSLQGGQSTYCDLMKIDSAERSNYSDLHLYERHTEVGNLNGADERESNRTYASLYSETREPSTNGHDKTYVNLVLKK